ncbi:hypothetical protein N7456_007952 [Penicillium angulare]|uniref:C2H2-type domain-containing protein n=1 Tax=Penicillium angulare TaxID=116970 RepID=A0A9W9K973_9EURO|nr:hypothetical protein N7456_007952 [Penicillium angulare]
MGLKSDIFDDKIDTTALLLAIDTVSVTKLREVLKSICEASPEAKRQANKELLVEDTEVKNGKPALKPGHIANEDNQLQSDPTPPFLHAPEKTEAAKVALEREHEMRAPYNPEVPLEGITGKRAVSRYALCENCEKEYDVTTNSSTACRYHPEEPQVDDESSLFDDDDYPELTEQDESLREEWPQYFLFGCCDGNLRDNPEGCIVDWHVSPSAIPSAKRARIM